MNWIEISMELQADLAEPAAELLNRVAPDGVAIDSLDHAVRVRAWLPDDGTLPDRKRRFREGLWHLSQIQPFPEPQFRRIQEEPWEIAWREQYQPLEIGDWLHVLPAWMEQNRGERIPIYLEPGMAFGTGAHTTTRHCLEVLEKLIEEGDSVADLGCGSGILSIAAARLGASDVVALDTDPNAVQLTKDNIRRNGVSDRISVLQGSLAEMDRPRRVIVANIQAPVLERFLRNGIAQFLLPEGWLVMSGILDDQLEPLLEASKRVALEVEQILATEDWRTAVFSLRSNRTSQQKKARRSGGPNYLPS